MAEYDDQNRCVKYTHPETLPDDTLHAANYALVIGRRGFPLIAEPCRNLKSKASESGLYSATRIFVGDLSSAFVAGCWLLLGTIWNV